MTARRFDQLLTLGLLVLAVGYALRMAAYPDRAGLVPALVGLVMAVTLVVQLLLLARGRHEGRREDVAEDGDGSPPDLEPDTYETLIALRGERRTKFLTIVGFIVIFYAVVLLAGFVVAVTLTIPLLLLRLRERPFVVVVGAVAAGAASYMFVVGLLGLPLVSGHLSRFVSL
jgi:hypothetical protein